MTWPVAELVAVFSADGPWGLAAVLLLLILLVQRELTVDSPSSRVRGLAKGLDLAIAPLLLVFGMLVVIKLWQTVS
jgi:hypothetical protein